MKYESVITDNTEAQLQKIARDKFGVEVIFHRGNNSQHPFGYTLIDHTHKQIYKGSDVVKLSELFKTERTNDKTINQQTHYKNLKDLSQKIEVSTTTKATNQGIQKLNEYLNDNDLLIFEKGEKIYLADEPNGELRELTSIKGLHNKEHFDFISIDGAQYFHEINQGMNQGGGVKVSSLLPSSDESETDRGQRRGIRR
jgi:hypothetical protein